MQHHFLTCNSSRQSKCASHIRAVHQIVPVFFFFLNRENGFLSIHFPGDVKQYMNHWSSRVQLDQGLLGLVFKFLSYDEFFNHFNLFFRLNFSNNEHLVMNSCSLKRFAMESYGSQYELRPTIDFLLFSLRNCIRTAECMCEYF